MNNVTSLLPRLQEQYVSVIGPVIHAETDNDAVRAAVALMKTEPPGKIAGALAVYVSRRARREQRVPLPFETTLVSHLREAFGLPDEVEIVLPEIPAITEGRF